MIKFCKRTLLVGSIAALMTSAGFAATQGTVGFNSTGTLDITLDVNDEVRISNLTDINLGVFAGVDVSGSSAACVYRNGTGNYQLTASGDGAAGAFTLTDGVATVPYSVTYDDGSGPLAATSGTAMTGLTGGDPGSTTCAGTGNNGTVTVTVLAADASGLAAATYAGILTLLVAPE